MQGQQKTHTNLLIYFNISIEENKIPLINPNPRSKSKFLGKVRRSSNLRARGTANILNNNSLTARSGNPHINSISTEPRRVLEVVVVSTGSALPRATTIGTDLKLGDSLIGIDDLHGEPVGGCTLLVLELDGAVEVARDVGPVDVDHAGRDVRQFGEG